jgi:hypothetical protein
LIPTLVSALLTCVGALVLGQAALRLCGAARWSWLAAPVGISILMLLAVPALHVPGGTATMAVVIAVAVVAAAAWCLRGEDHRPPVGGLAAAAPVVLLTLVPFLANGRFGTIGVSFNNDMGAHMLLVEAYMSDAVAAVTPLLPDYPLGPHAVVAVLADGLGIRVDEAFAGFTIALPILTAWAALALVGPDARWPRRALVATVVGMPFLVAAYYGQGAFKEVLQANLVLAVALLLAGYGPRLGRLRWVPLGLLTAGILSVYSVTGLPWPLALLGLWLAGRAVAHARSGGLRAVWARARRELPSVGIAVAALVVLLIPQLGRLERYVSLRREVDGIGIRDDDIGNLIGPLPGWEAFGVWTNPDFRAAASFTGGMLTAFVLGLVLLGVLWALRRGRWMLPLAAAAAMAIWAVSAETQSPYVAAKALVIASPLLLALAVLPLVDRGPARPPWWSLAPLLGLSLAVLVAVSDLRALRVGQVGATDHLRELRDLRDRLDGRPTLFLGNDDFIRWELAGVPVGTPEGTAAGQLPVRPEKSWAYGQPLDFDSVDTATLNAHDWVVTTRDAAASTPPPQLRLAGRTPSYALWRRVGRVAPRAVLGEGASAGASLDCGAHPAVVRRGGVAGVRTPPVAVPGATVTPGGQASVKIPLLPGGWELTASYTSPLPVEVKGPGLRTTLPANLDRPGPRWWIGRVVPLTTEPITLTFATSKPLLAPASALAVVPEVVATPVERTRVVPLDRACGRYVDWYRPARRARGTSTAGG